MQLAIPLASDNTWSTSNAYPKDHLGTNDHPIYPGHALKAPYGGLFVSQPTNYQSFVGRSEREAQLPRMVSKCMTASITQPGPYAGLNCGGQHPWLTQWIHDGYAPNNSALALLWVKLFATKINQRCKSGLFWVTVGE